MKKIACLSFLAGTAMLATEVQAVPNRIYVGLDYAVHQNSVDDNGPTFRSVNPNINYTTEYPEDFQAPSINVGYNFSENFGIEAFYQTSSTEDDRYFGVWNSLDTLASETDFQAYGVDLMAYLKTTDKVDWLLSAGVAQYEYSTKFKYQYLNIYREQEIEEDGLGIRLGTGFQINFDDYVSFRAMYRYIFSDVPGLKHAQEFLIGVRVGFFPFYY